MAYFVMCGKRQCGAADLPLQEFVFVYDIQIS